MTLSQLLDVFFAAVLAGAAVILLVNLVTDIRDGFREPGDW